MTRRPPSEVLAEHLQIRRGESAAYIPEWELAEAIRTAVSVLEAAENNARLMAEARAQLLASRKRSKAA